MVRGASAMAPEEAVMELKETGNALFRTGDFRGAADAFQRALEAAKKMSGSMGDAADPELACLCNLAYAWIKEGSMEDAEEACCRALEKQPTCVKALFRRGQARLALGRFVEASTDFREVTNLEPNNAEASKMLRLTQQEQQQQEELEHRPPLTSEVSGEASPQLSRQFCTDKGGLESKLRESIPLLPSSTARRETAGRESIVCVDQGNTRGGPPRVLAGSGCGGTLSPNSSGGGSHKAAGVKSEGGGQGELAPQSIAEISVAPSSSDVSSFMVPNWLSSAQQGRKGGHHEDRGNFPSIDDPQCLLDGSRSPDLTEMGTSGAVQSTVSVSRLVSRLSASRLDASREGKSQCGSAVSAAVQAEWSCLQAEESKKVQESLRRWSSRKGSHAAVSAATSVKVEPVNDRHSGIQGRKKKGNKTLTSSKTAIIGNEPRETNRACEVWASLEEEESHVRKAFRAKLSIGETVATKKKTQKKPQKKKQSAASRLSTRDPP